MKTLVVVGDVLLDVDIDTRAERLSPDGPVPVLDEQHRQERAGGAALAAALAARTGADVALVAPLPPGADADRARSLLDPRIRLIALPAEGSTPVKTRLRSGGHTVARLDRGAAGAEVRAVPAAVQAELESAGAVLVSDYGAGTTINAELRELLARAARRVPVVWDPHPRGGDPVAGAIVTPNAGEAARATDKPGSDLTTVRQQAEHLLQRWDARALAVTLGSRGALLVDGSGRSTVFAPPFETSGDACGAGDCFAATVTIELLSQALPSEAVARGVDAATRFLAGGGAATMGEQSLATTGDTAEGIVAAARAAGRTVVATGGCFDLLHAGHVAMLSAARRLGDVLIVCVNSDESVRRLKGPSRPLQTAADRVSVLRALRAVDAVVVFEEDTPTQVLDRLRPDVWVKGDDYAGTPLPEAEVVRRWGGEVVTVPYLDGRSTTGLLELGRR